MLDLYEELLTVTRAFAAAKIEYAICGGMAMAIHSIPRNTVDLDLLIRREDLERSEQVAAGLGYTFRARPVMFSDGTVEIRRITKVDPESHDPLMLDLLLVTPAIEDVWSSRQAFETAEGEVISVVSREGLVKLKSFRSSGRDLDDIKLLRGETE